MCFHRLLVSKLFKTCDCVRSHLDSEKYKTLCVLVCPSALGILLLNQPLWFCVFATLYNTRFHPHITSAASWVFFTCLPGQIKTNTLTPVGGRESSVQRTCTSLNWRKLQKNRALDTCKQHAHSTHKRAPAGPRKPAHRGLLL